MAKLDEFRKTAADYLTRPAVRLLAKTSITPNAITWFGFLLSIEAAVLIGTGYLFAAGFLVLVAGLFDLLDGALARHTNQATHFGAVLDSTLDRIAETIILLGILILYIREQSTLGILLVGIALPSSQMVSYIRARAEAAGLECRVGLFTRGERVIVLALGLLLSRIDYALIIALSVIVLFSLFTAGQRLLHVWHQRKSE
ncbi:MAG: CDP-alcohol phosphatidyltransferase family protein [Dehalococcoidia bacterium]|nr:MAG: CDP-alcohol phosphatidyltransferase family protein [Dehalococcoidia bacterium]